MLLAAAQAAVCMVPSSGLAGGTSGTYSDTSSGGLWSSPSNWTGGIVANGQDGVADFSTLTLPGNNTVHLDSSRTIGGLNFGDQGGQYSWTLDNNGNSSNILTLSTSTTAAPVINVYNQPATISTNLAGTQGFTLNGGGVLNLNGNGTYTGTTTIANGTVVLGSPASTAAGSPTAGAAFDLDPILSQVQTNGSTVTGVTDLTGNGNNATSTSAPGSVTLGTINGHSAFTFSSSGLNVPTYSAHSNTGTVFAVIDPTSVAGPGAIVGAYDGSSSGGLELRVYSGSLGALNESVASLGTSSAITANVPSVIAYSYNSSGGTFYLNGTAIGTTSAPSFTGSGTLTIGYKYSNGSQNEEFSGSIGTLLGYNTSLGSAAIATTTSYLASEYATATTLGTSAVNLTSANSNLSLANSAQAISSLAGVAGSNVYLGGGVLNVGGSGASTVYAGNISDSGTGSVGTGGQFVKVGSGMLTLSGSVTNTGGTQVNAGTLLVSGTYATSGPTIVTAGTMSVTGVDSDTGNHTISGGTLSISGAETTNGSFAIGSSGTLILAGNNTGSSPISFTSGGTLILQASASNITNINTAGATSSAIGSPGSDVYAAVTNVQLQSDSSVTFLNSAPTGGQGNATLNFTVNQLTSAGVNQTLTLGTSQLATYQTYINVAGGNGYTLAIPSINANGAFLALNESTGNLSIPGGISSVSTLTVKGAANTTIGPISGVSLAKSGTGTLLLTGSNAFTGATTISGGTLALGSAGSFASTTAITLSNSAIFDISAVPSFILPSTTTVLSGSGTINGSYNHSVGVLYAGSSSVVGTLNVNGNLTLGGGTVDVNLNGSNNSTGGLANDLINVSGALDVVGNQTLSLTPVVSTLPVGTTWTVLTYNSSSGLIGGGSLNVSSSQFTVVEVPGAIELKYTSGQASQDVWTGSVNSNWDTSTTNFVPAGLTTPIAFSNGDAVIFNDSSSVTTVNLTTTLQPITITVNSNVSNYTFTGSGSITGPATLLKQGTSTLTISNSNTYTGTTNIAGGTLVANNTTGSAIGTGPVIIGAGAMLQVGDGGNDGAIQNGNTDTNTITDNGVLSFNSSSTSLQPPMLITGTGSLYINASMGIGNHNTYTGGTTIAGGDVVAYENDSFGTGLVNINGGTVDVQYGAKFLNNFNMSGNALIEQYFIAGTGIAEIDGFVNLTGDTTLQMPYGGSIKFYGSPTALTGTNQNLTVNGASGYFGTFSIAGNVNLGTGTISTGSGVTLQFAPPAATTISIAAGIVSGSTVQQKGLGTTVLDGSNTYTGGTTVTTGTLVFNAPNALPNFSALTIASTGVAQVANYSAGSTKNTLFTSSLSIAVGGKLDLGNNDLVVQNGSLSGITAEVALGYNGGKWNGASGITSSAAAADAAHLHALGVIQNVDANGNTLYGGDLPSFDGANQSNSTDILVKYTYYGDANLDGKVDGSDYSLVDTTYIGENFVNGVAKNPISGWYNGDFNYDGVVDGSDYTLMDNAFNTQGAQISAQVASPTALVSGTSAVPEPTTLGLLGIGAVGLLGRRGSRRRH